MMESYTRRAAGGIACQSFKSSTDRKLWIVLDEQCWGTLPDLRPFPNSIIPTTMHMLRASFSILADFCCPLYACFLRKDRTNLHIGIEMMFTSSPAALPSYFISAVRLPKFSSVSLPRRRRFPNSFRVNASKHNLCFLLFFSKSIAISI